MKLLFSILIIVSFKSATYADECIDLEGVYQTNLPQGDVADIEFEILEQRDCSNISISRGYWNSLLEKPVANINSSLDFSLNGNENFLVELFNIFKIIEEVIS
mgnify:CR=1 FL=1